MSTNRGSALLAVLWLAAALSAIAFSVATTVRGEIERSATSSDGVKEYFLARGAIDRALLYVMWGEQFRNPDGSPRYWAPGVRRLHFEFPTGTADVEFIPESSKLNVNTATPEELYRLLITLGTEDSRARDITAAILDWRAPVPNGISIFDQFYLASNPSFRARHASFEEIEELLLVKGMTPDLFHGTYTRDTNGRLVPRPGLHDCLSVYSSGSVEANTAQPAVLAAVGLPADLVAAIVTARKTVPFISMDQVQAFAGGQSPAIGRLVIGTGSITTLRATARMRLQNGQLSDMRRTVSALVKFAPTTHDAPYHILRWYDQGGLGVGDFE